MTVAPSTVGEVLVAIEAGKSVKTKERPARPGELGILKVSAVTWGEFRPEENKAILDDYDPGDCPRPMRGDLLISRANTRDLVGAPVLVDEDHPNLLLSDKILRLVPDDARVDRRYLARALRSAAARKHFESRAGGTSGSMTNVTQDDIRSAPVLLPSLPEQRRIANLLDMADAIRRKRKEAIALTKALLRSAFLEMFGDPIANPKGWPVSPLGDLVAIRGGGTPSRARPEFFEGSIPWATAKDFRSDFMSDTEEHVSEKALAASAAKLVPPGTILVVVKSKILMRRLPVAISTVPLCFNQDVKGLVAHELSEAPYLATHLRLAQRKLLELARGVNTEGLTLDHLRTHPVMRPPGAEVRRFVALEAKLRRSSDWNVQGAALAEKLFSSLVARLLSGGASAC